MKVRYTAAAPKVVPRSANRAELVECHAFATAMRKSASKALDEIEGMWRFLEETHEHLRRMVKFIGLSNSPSPFAICQNEDSGTKR